MAEAKGATLALDAQNPWPGLAAYDESARQYFRGRDADSQELRRLIGRSAFVMLYGKSGLGKSSLLQAGVFPALREERCLPVYLRLDYSEGAALPLLDQALDRLVQAAREAGADAAAPQPGESLWSYLQRRDAPVWNEQNDALLPVLVFDQFEELFSRGGSPAHVKRVLDALADLAGNRVPGELAADRDAARRLNLRSQQYQVVLSFRSDFLAEVETWARQASLPKRESLHLRAMSRDVAVKAVAEAGAEVLAAGTAERIVDFLLERMGEQAGARGEVEPVLLSLCCYQLNLRRQRDGRAFIDPDLVQAAGEGILKGFYEDGLREMPQRVAEFIEDRLILGDRYRNSYPKAEALKPGALLPAELDELIAKRLLRIDPQGSEDRIELIHDRLVSVVRDARDARRAREAQQREHEAAARAAEAALEQLRREQQEAERAREVQYARERGEAEQLLRRKAERWLRFTMVALVATLAAIGGLVFFYLQEQKQIEALNDTSESLNNNLAKVTQERDEARQKAEAAELRAANLELAAAKDQQARDEAARRQAAAQAEQDKRRAEEEARIAAAASSATSTTLRIGDWSLSSGGCGKGQATVTGPVEFTVLPRGKEVELRQTFEGRGQGVTAKTVPEKRAPVAQAPNYDIESVIEWKRGDQTFRTRSVERISVDASGRPTRASLMRIRTECG